MAFEHGENVMALPRDGSFDTDGYIRKVPPLASVGTQGVPAVHDGVACVPQSWSDPTACEKNNVSNAIKPKLWPTSWAKTSTEKICASGDDPERVVENPVLRADSLEGLRLHRHPLGATNTFRLLWRMYVSQMPPTKPSAATSATPNVEPQLRCVRKWLRQTCCDVGRPAPRTGCVT